MAKQQPIGHYVRMTQKMYDFVQSKLTEDQSGPDYIRDLIAKEMGDNPEALTSKKKNSAKKTKVEKKAPEPVVQTNVVEEEDEFPFE